MLKRVITALLASLVMLVSAVAPAAADYAYLTVTGNPLTAPQAPYLVLSGLSGQSTCSITVNTAGGTFAVNGLYKNTTTWTGPLTLTKVEDGTTTATTVTTGSYYFSCATMTNVRVDGTAATGTPSVTLNASGGFVSKRAGGAGTITAVNGTSPISSSTTGGVATISCPTCNTGPNTSVQAGTGILVATPSPGVFVVSATGTSGVTAVTGSGNIASSGGATPNVTITDAPTFAGNVKANQTLSTASIGTLGYGCASEALFAAGVYTLTGSNYSCSSSTSGTFVIPTVGSTVSVPVAAGFAIHNINTPVTISDGTRSISGNTTTTTTGTSTALVISVQRVNSGTVGNTVSSGAEIVTGGYDAGATTVVTGTAPIVSTGGTTPAISCPTCVTTASTYVQSVSNGTNITLSGTAKNPVINTSNTISITGLFQATTPGGYQFYAGSGGAQNNPQAFAATNNNGNNSDFGTSSTTTVNGISGICFFASQYNGNVFMNSLFAVDCSGNMGLAGALTTTNVTDTGLTTGKFVCATTSGLLSTSTCSGNTFGHFLINLGFGYVSGTVNTANDYPSEQVPGYTAGTLTKLRASCKGADNGTTVFTFTDSTTSTTIGTIAMANTAKTGTTTLGTPFTLTAGDQLTASVTTAGTATGCGLTAEGQASTF